MYSTSLSLAAVPPGGEKAPFAGASNSAPTNSPVEPAAGLNHLALNGPVCRFMTVPEPTPLEKYTM